MITSSYTSRSSVLSEDIYPGSIMPKLELDDSLGNTLDLNKFKGEKVLINFWAAYDAKSHMENVLLWNTLEKEGHPIVMLSVSFDKSKSVFEQTVKLDGIAPENQFCETDGSDSEVYKKYQLEKGFKNYLIDENGVIVAMNLTPKELANYLN